MPAAIVVNGTALLLPVSRPVFTALSSGKGWLSSPRRKTVARQSWEPHRQRPAAFPELSRPLRPECAECHIGRTHNTTRLLAVAIKRTSNECIFSSGGPFPFLHWVRTF